MNVGFTHILLVLTDQQWSRRYECSNEASSQTGTSC